MLEESGYQIRIIWEYAWQKLSSDSEIISFTQPLKSVRPRCCLPFSKILNRLQTGELFGFVLVDIQTPETIKHYFAEVLPIFKKLLLEERILEI